MLDHRTIIDTVHRYADVVKKELSPAAIVLFGSYAKGTAHEKAVTLMLPSYSTVLLVTG